MEHILNFMSDLILFTAGLAVITLWIIIFVEIFDNVSEIIKEVRGKNTNQEDQEV